MKATVVLIAVVCLLVGGIVGWGLKGRLAPTGQAAMIDITPAELTDAGNNRLAVFDGRTMTVVEYWHTGQIQIKTRQKIK